MLILGGGGYFTCSKVVSTHRTGTHPLRNLYQQVVSRESFHSWRPGDCRTGCALSGCVVTFLEGYTLEIVHGSPKSHPIEEENHLPSTSMFRFHLFRGASLVLHFPSLHPTFPSLHPRSKKRPLLRSRFDVLKVLWSNFYTQVQVSGEMAVVVVYFRFEQISKICRQKVAVRPF